MLYVVRSLLYPSAFALAVSNRENPFAFTFNDGLTAFHYYSTRPPVHYPEPFFRLPKITKVDYNRRTITFLNKFLRQRPQIAVKLK